MNNFSIYTGIFLLGVCGILASGLYFCYERIITIEGDNRNLRETVQTINKALLDEIARGEHIASVTERLLRQDHDRQTEFKKFSRTLGVLKTVSAELRDVLATIVPRDALAGLRSFGDSLKTRGGGTDPKSSDAAHVVPGKL